MDYDDNGNAIYNMQLKTVTIKSGCTFVSDYAFYQCGIKSLSLPSSLKAIGQCAFAYNKFNKLSIPGGVKTIKFGAFLQYTTYKPYLKSVTISKTVTSIDDKAFGFVSDYQDAKKISGYKIIGTKGSAAEQYAKKNKFVFSAITSKTDASKYSIKLSRNSYTYDGKVNKRRLL